MASFTLKSPTTQGNAPFTVGLAFAKGDMPASVAADLSLYQVVVKRQWSDGSVKHAIVSGRADLVANTGRVITLAAGAATSGSNLTSANIITAAPTASVQCGALGTVNLSDLLASSVRTWISGPEMVECHYRADVGGGTLLSAWFHVRLYADGRLRIRVSVENGYLDNGAGAVSVKTTQNYVPTVIIGGATVYSNGGVSLEHYSNTAWSAMGWIGGDPQVTATHDVAYLRSTKLVPNYAWFAPSESAISAQVQTYTPMTRGAWTQHMGDTGYQEQTGILCRWDALYCTSGDPRCLASVEANALSLRSYAIAWKSKATNDIARPTVFPNWSLSGPNQGGDNITGAGTLTWEISHHGSGGYLAYLLTGDYIHLDTMAMQSSLCYFAVSTAQGSGLTKRMSIGQTRGIAWIQRTLGQYAAIAPTGDSIAADYRAVLENDYGVWDSIAAAPSNSQLGYPYVTSSYGSDVPLLAAPWQYHYWIQVNGYNSDLEPGFSSSTAHHRFRDWMYKAIVGILGDTGSGNFYFGAASTYTITISPNAYATYMSVGADNLYATWGEVYQASFGYPNTDTSNILAGGSAGTPSSAPTGYWGRILPAICYAVDHGAPGAADSYARLTGASNWSVLTNSGFDDIPIWGTAPRFYSAPVTTGKSIRVDTASLISGAMVVGDSGLGLLGSAVPSSGLHGASFLYNDLILPADNGKEIRGLIVTPPASGTFFAYEDGSFSYTGPSTTFVYRLYEDGVDKGTTTGTITIDAATLSGGATLDGIGAGGALAPSSPSNVSGSATLDGIGVSGTLTSSGPSDLSGGATLGGVDAGGDLADVGPSELSGSADLGGVTASGDAAQDPGEPTLVASELRRYWSARQRNVFRGDRGMYNHPLGPKDPSEIKTILFDFGRDLGDATIVSVVEATPTTYRGTDPSPAGVKISEPVIDGTTVLVRMGGGVDGAAYKWLIRVEDSAANVHAMTDWVLVRSL